MYFKQIQVGGYDKNFVYFAGDETTREIAVVDPSNLALLQTWIDREKVIVKAILITHGHFDHTEGAAKLQEQTGAVAYMHPANSAREGLMSDRIAPLNDGGTIDVGTLKIKAIFTPGHTNDSVCYLAENKLMTGDTLFIGGCGRCDLAGGSAKDLYLSLYGRIAKLPDDTEIYPGHDYGKQPHSTLSWEKQTNKYLRLKSQDAFVAIRMGK
jgi:glyoxylase-like metal-dependent hydrolase (beta-lactamase superfamily II)